MLGNVAFYPSSALTRATLVEMVRDPDICAPVRNIMIEVEAVANQLAIELKVSIDRRIAGAEKVGEHKTSMLQDLEAGRPRELDAIVGAVVEFPMPHTRGVRACTKLLDVISPERARRNAAAARFGGTRMPRRPVHSRGGKK